MEDWMSDLIPNLDDLRAKLPAEESASDAHEFVKKLARAGTLAEIDANIDALVDRWLEVSDDSE
jgi:hypothetical protein